MIYSTFKEQGLVKFPAWNAERVYMQEFTKKEGLPKHLGHWQDTVDQMLDGIDNTGKIYLMVDQGFVKAGNTHRRGGLHVDGYWEAELNDHSGRHTGISCHVGDRGSHLPPPSKKWNAPRHNGGHLGLSNTSELIVLASDVKACRGVIGAYAPVEWNGGDYSHLNLQDLESHLLEPNKVYMGDTGSFLHESLPINKDCYRTVVRLNVKVH